MGKNRTIWELVPNIEQGSYGFTEFRSNLRHSVTQAVSTAFSSTSWYKVAPFFFTVKEYFVFGGFFKATIFVEHIRRL